VGGGKPGDRHACGHERGDPHESYPNAVGTLGGFECGSRIGRRFSRGSRILDRIRPTASLRPAVATHTEVLPRWGFGRGFCPVFSRFLPSPAGGGVRTGDDASDASSHFRRMRTGWRRPGD